MCFVDEIELGLRIMRRNSQDKLKVHMYAVGLALRFLRVLIVPAPRAAFRIARPFRLAWRAHPPTILSQGRVTVKPVSVGMLVWLASGRPQVVGFGALHTLFVMTEAEGSRVGFSTYQRRPELDLGKRVTAKARDAFSADVNTLPWRCIA